MLSTSSGLTALAPLPKSKPLSRNLSLNVAVLVNGTPSMTYSGWLFPLRELTPRTMTDLDEPGSEDEFEIWRPATLPCRLDMMSFVRAAAMSSPFTAVAENPSAFAERLIPKAVTTTSSSAVSSGSRTTFMSRPAVTSRDFIPTEEMRSLALAGTDNVNLPS